MKILRNPDNYIEDDSETYYDISMLVNFGSDFQKELFEKHLISSLKALEFVTENKHRSNELSIILEIIDNGKNNS